MSPRAGDNAATEYAHGIVASVSIISTDRINHPLACPRCGYPHCSQLLGLMGDPGQPVCERCFYHPGWNEAEE